MEVPIESGKVRVDQLFDKPQGFLYDSWVNLVNISAAAIYLLNMCKP